MKERDSLIDTIQRLLALSGSPNEHEAKLALAKAQELMLRHNLSMAEVTATEIGKQGWTEEEAWRGKRPSWEQDFVADVLQGYFFVKCLWYKTRTGYRRTENTFQIFGSPDNVAVARHVFVYLSRTFRDLWEEYRRKTFAGRGLARTYYEGLRNGFMRKLELERAVQVNRDDRKNALVVVTDAIQKAFAELHPEVKVARRSPVRSDADTYYDGFERGQKINLHHAVGNQRNVPALPKV